MEILLFTFVGVALYFISDSIVKAIEKRKGELLPNRSLIFFAIIMVLSLVTFNFLQVYGKQLGLIPTTSQNPAPSAVEQQKATESQEIPVTPPATSPQN